MRSLKRTLFIAVRQRSGCGKLLTLGHASLALLLSHALCPPLIVSYGLSR